ncbi:MAG TPA: class I SAM-dependent methyltransferase [Burkholderiales bacterium]
MQTQTVSRTTPDYGAIKARQQQTWASGDYAVIGTTLQLVGESLCEALDLRPGSLVLDVAAGNGNATLAAARRACDVVSTDYVPALLERGRARAEAEGFDVRFERADAENLPYPDASFDVVLSTFGVMFAPNQVRAAAELARVCRPGGRIGLANWTPDSFIGSLFKLIGRYVPPPAGLESPLLWGTEERLRQLFPKHQVSAERRDYVFRYRSPQNWLDTFRAYYGPTHKAFGALDADRGAALAEEILALIATHNRGGDAMIVPSPYLEVAVTVG